MQAFPIHVPNNRLTFKGRPTWENFHARLNALKLRGENEDNHQDNVNTLDVVLCGSQRGAECRYGWSEEFQHRVNLRVEIDDRMLTYSCWAVPHSFISTTLQLIPNGKGRVYPEESMMASLIEQLVTKGKTQEEAEVLAENYWSDHLKKESVLSRYNKLMERRTGGLASAGPDTGPKFNVRAEMIRP